MPSVGRQIPSSLVSACIARASSLVSPTVLLPVSRAMSGDSPQGLTLAPTSDPTLFVAPDGRRLRPPAGWECLPPGDAGLTRRVKAAGPWWAVIERRGRKAFSKGLWAPAENIAAARAALAAERDTEAYAKRRESDKARRDRAQAAYVVSFEQHVHAFLRFAPRYQALAQELARAIAEHATPVGSGTVARTERIPVAQRAEAATIAWMRHQTTAYDSMAIPRVAGARREVRRELAEISRAILDLHRRDAPHAAPTCPLCTRRAPAAQPASEKPSAAVPSPGRRASAAFADEELDDILL